MNLAREKVTPEGRAPDDPQNTEGTLTDNTDSRVGLKDTTDTTPGYFYKNEVDPEAASSGPGLDSGGGNEGIGEHRAVKKQAKGDQPPDTRKSGGLPPPNIPYFEGLSPPSKEEEEARTQEFSGTLVQPPEPPEMRAAGKGTPGGSPPGPPGSDPEGTVPFKQSFEQQDEGDMTNVRWGEKPEPDKMLGDYRQHYKP
ncbi:hypothetical protein WJX81_004828 [Elliptochloris bilobata]|uniref:Uncharacterized protein n=1 Tax=Elliptochloris bilobata TaxID=381761 RepID=A0AAW1RFM9_9CHLO